MAAIGLRLCRIPLYSVRAAVLAAFRLTAPAVAAADLA